MDSDAEETEHSPLLPHATTALPQVHSPNTIILISAAVVCFLVSSGAISDVPRTRIFEDIICHHHYDKANELGHIAPPSEIDESFCKGDEIQSELASLLGLMSMLDNVPGLLVTIPYGLLADRIGRKYVCFIALFGGICSEVWIMVVAWYWQVFPLKLVLFGPLFTLVGGGSPVLMTAIYALASDVSTDSTRANHFFLIGCAAMFPESIAPSIASLTMKTSPWIACFCATIALFIGGFCLVFLPETLHLHPVNGTTTPIDLESESASIASIEQPSKINNENFWARSLSFARGQKEKFYAATEVLHSSSVVALIFTLLPVTITGIAIELSTRYISKRYSWTLANAGFLLSLRSAIHLALLVAVLPGISYLLTKKPTANSLLRRFELGLTDHAKDLFLARVSFILLIGGLVFFALAPTIGVAIAAVVILTLGMGYSQLCRSLITNMVDQKHVGRLYSIIAVLQTLGAVAGSPTLAVLFSAGIKRARQTHSSVWEGLPFLATATLVLICSSGLWYIRSDMKKSKKGIYVPDVDHLDGSDEAFDEVH